MFRNVLTALWVILPITLLSAGLAYWRAEQMAVAPGQVAARELPAVRVESAKGWVISSLIFGLLATLLYLWMAGRWPDTASKIYLELAIGSAVLFSILAVIVCPMLKKNCVPEFIALNFLWGLGYGWLLPLILR